MRGDHGRQINLQALSIAQTIQLRATPLDKIA
jgi:hypothetical protein